MSLPSFHVLNGDSTLALLRQTAVPGEFLVWPDMLMEGPLLRGRDGGPAWPSRAAFLASRYGIPRAAALARMRAFSRALGAVLKGNGEVTLWFEEDWFCQIHLVCLLATLPPAALRRGRIRVIRSARPLGLLSPKALERLYARRLEADPRCVALSRKVWSLLSRPAGAGRKLSQQAPEAWSSGRKLEALLGKPGEFASWPRLKAGLKAHLHRRPFLDGSAADGAEIAVGPVEMALLASLRKRGGRGAAFSRIFPEISRHPRIKTLGLGDLQVARCALDLARLENAPLRIEGMRGGRESLAGLSQWRLYPSGPGVA